MMGPLSAAIRNEPTLRHVTNVVAVDLALVEARSDTMGKDLYMQHLKEQSANDIGRFFLREGLISFSEKKYLNEVVTFASVWTISPDTPGLDGRLRDLADERLRGRAEAAREILDVHSRFPNSSLRLTGKAYDIIVAVEDKFRG